MDVGFVVYDGLGRTTGGFRYDRRLVAGLRDRGDSVSVIDIPWRSYPRNLADNASRRLRSRLADDFDLLVQDELCHPSLVWLNRRLPDPPPIVSVVHHLRADESHPRPLSAVYRRVERAYLRSVDGVVANSRPTRASAAATAGVDRPAVVAPPGRDHLDPAATADVSPDAIRARAREGPLRVTFLGTVVPRKGLDTLVAGLARLDRAAPGRDWELTVLGDRTAAPDYVARVERLAADRGVADAVTFRGRVPDAAVHDRLAASHALAVPSTHEGFGIAYLEAMGFGVVPLATAAGGASDLIDDGETGLLVPPEDPAAVADRLGGLAADRGRLAELGVAARRRFEAHPTWAETVERVRGFLIDLVG